MASDSGDIPKLTGLSKYFNSYTTRGKANVALAVYAMVFLGYMSYKLKSKPKAD